MHQVNRAFSCMKLTFIVLPVSSLSDDTFVAIPLDHCGAGHNMLFSTGLMFAGVVTVIMVALMLCFRKATQNFSAESPHGKDFLYDFLKSPSCLQQIHPSIETVEHMREENGTSYFEVIENLGTLVGKKRVSMSLKSYTDLSTHKSYIRLENHETLVKACITLVIGGYNPLAKAWSVHSLSTSPQSPARISAAEALPRTPPPSPANMADQGTTPRSTTIQVLVEVSLVGGLAHLVARHLVHVWKISLTNTNTLLARKTDS